MAMETSKSFSRRFASNQLTSIQHDLDVLKNHTAEKQEPFAAVLTCADSRIPVELIFDQTIGHIFVTRVAGNAPRTAADSALILAPARGPSGTLTRSTP